MKILLLLTALICCNSSSWARAFWPDYNSAELFGGYTDDYQLDEAIKNLNSNYQLPFVYGFDDSPEEADPESIENENENDSDVVEAFSNRHYYQVQNTDEKVATPEKSSEEFVSLSLLGDIQPNDEVSFKPLNGAQPNDEIDFELLNDKKETPEEIENNKKMEEIENDFEKYYSLYMKNFYNDDVSVGEAEAEAESEHEKANGSSNIPSNRIPITFEPEKYFNFEPLGSYKETPEEIENNSDKEETDNNNYNKANLEDPELFNSLEKLVVHHNRTGDYEEEEGSTEAEAEIENNSDKEETEDDSLEKLMTQIWGADEYDDDETPESYRKSEDNALEKLMAQLWSTDDYYDYEVSTDAEVEAKSEAVEQPEEITENPNKKRIIFSAHIPLGSSDSNDHFKFEVFGRDIESQEIVQNDNNNNKKYVYIENYHNNANDESSQLLERITQVTSSLAPQPQEVDLLRQLSLSSSNSALLNQEYSANVIEFLTVQENLKESLDFLHRQNEQLNLEFYLSSIVRSDYNSQQHARLETEMSAMLSKLDEARQKVLQLQSMEQKRNYHHLLEALVQEIYGK